MNAQELIKRKEEFELIPGNLPIDCLNIFQNIRNGQLPTCSYGILDRPSTKGVNSYSTRVAGSTGTGYRIIFRDPTNTIDKFVYLYGGSNSMVMWMNNFHELEFISNRIQVSEETFFGLLNADLFAPQYSKDYKKMNAFIRVAEQEVQEEKGIQMSKK